MPIRSAVIGYGYWGRNVARAIHNSTDFTLHTIYDEDKTAQAKAQEDYEIVPYVSYEAILADSKIQAIFIITPPQTHFALAESALKHQYEVRLSAMDIGGGMLQGRFTIAQILPCIPFMMKIKPHRQKHKKIMRLCLM